MAGEKESFVFYKSFYEALQDLKDKERLKVYDAICELALNNNDTKLIGLPKTIFTLIKPQILANTKRYENGKKGGRPKKETTGFEKKKTIGFENTETKTKPNENVNVNVNDNVNVNENADGFCDADVAKIDQLMIECLNTTNTNNILECTSYLDKLPVDVIEYVLKKTSRIANPNWAYAMSILDDYVKKDIVTLELAKADDLKHKSNNNKQNQSGKMQSNFEQRQYSEEFLESLYANKR